MRLAWASVLAAERLSEGVCAAARLVENLGCFQMLCLRERTK